MKVSSVSLTAFVLVFSNCAYGFFFGSLLASSRFQDYQSGGCGMIPGHVQAQFQESLKFSETCRAAHLPDNKMIVINDYSGQGPNRMYVFNKAGQCQISTPIAFGNGGGGAMVACATESSYMTPPGFHLTIPHNGGRYDTSNSLGLGGLSGQPSSAEATRAVLIHGSSGSGANTLGCTGVPYADFPKIQRLLGYGSLVNNYFGQPPKMGCSDGRGTTPTCQPENPTIRQASLNNGGSPLSTTPGHSSPRSPSSSWGGTL